MTSSPSKPDLLFAWRPEATPHKFPTLWKIAVVVAILSVMVLAFTSGNESDKGSSLLATAAEKPTQVAVSKSAPVAPAAPEVFILNAGAADKVAAEKDMSATPEPAQARPHSEKLYNRSDIVRKPTAQQPPSTYSDLRRQMLEGQ